MTPTVVYAEVVSRGCTAEMYVNGIPLGRVDPETTPHLEIAANEFVVDGVNELALIVAPGPTPGSALADPASRTLQGEAAAARLVRYRPDEFVGGDGGATLLEIGWEPVPGTDETLPRMLTQRTDLGPQFGRWDWQDAPVLTLDGQLLAEAGDVLRRLHGAMAAGDGRSVAALLSDAYADLARAYPARAAADLAAEMEGFIARMSAQPDWRMALLDGETIDFRLCAGGRMLECIDKDWQPTLRTEPLADGMPFTVALFLARIDGRLKVVR